MHVVTGATGHTGKDIATSLLNSGKHVRVISRSAERLKGLADKGAEPMVGNLEDAAFVEKAFEGALAAYAMIPPNMETEDFRAYQNRIADNLLRAIRKGHVRYVVTLSSVGAHLDKHGGIVQGLHDMEERFDHFHSLRHLKIVHLRPTFFMENLFGQIDTIKKMGVMGSPIRADLSFPIVATKDVADVAGGYLETHNFKGSNVRYILGKKNVTFKQIATILGRDIGKPDLAYVQFSNAEAKKIMREQGMSENVADAMIEFMESMNESKIFSHIKRKPENTTTTSLEGFSYIFANMYKQEQAV